MSLRQLLGARTKAAFDQAKDAALAELQTIFAPDDWGIDVELKLYNATSKQNIWQNELRSTIKVALQADGKNEDAYAAFLDDVHFAIVAVYWRGLFDSYKSNRGWRVLLMGIPAARVLAVGFASHYQNAQAHNRLGEVSKLLYDFATAALAAEGAAVAIGRRVAPDDWDKVGLVVTPIVEVAGTAIPPDANGHGLHIKDVRTTTVKKIIASYVSVAAYDSSAASSDAELEARLHELQSAGRVLATVAFPFNDLRAFEQIRSLALSDLAAARNRFALRSRAGSKSVVRTFYGPPGTGKTLAAVRDAVRLADPHYQPANDDPKDYFLRFNELRDQVAFVTFHPSLQYEDLVESIRPALQIPDAERTEDDSESGDSESTAGGTQGRQESVPALRYYIYEGPLLRLIRRAAEHPGDEHVLVIDEINRGDVSRVLGPLISALEADKRAGADFPVGFERQYPRSDLETRIFVPSNLHFIGTMNSADRNIALVDYALRRRFEFVECPPRPELLGTAGAEPAIDLQTLLVSLNRRIEFLLDRDHRIGHAYFMGCRTALEVVGVLAKRIIPTLYEYFYGNERLMSLVVGDTPGRPHNIFVVREEAAAFQELFGMDAAAAGAFGYRSRESRVTVSLDPRFWNQQRLVPAPDDEAYAIEAVRKIYAGTPT